MRTSCTLPNIQGAKANRSIPVRGYSKQSKGPGCWGYFFKTTRAYVKHRGRRGPRRKGVNMDVILSPLSLMATSLLALVRGIAISIIIMQAVIACSCYVVS